MYPQGTICIDMFGTICTNGGMFKIFDKLGGKEQALDVLEQRMGLRPGVNALKRWYRLRTCSGRATLAFMLECQARGIPFDITDCKLPAVERSERKRRAA